MSRNTLMAAVVVCLSAGIGTGCSDDGPTAPQQPGVSWLNQSFGAGFEQGNAVATDGDDNIIVAGEFRNEAKIGSNTFTENGSGEVLLAKYAKDGSLLWAQQAGGTGTDDALDVATDVMGNIFITGAFSGTATFGGVNVVSAGSQDIYVAKLDPQGNTLWAVGAGGGSFESGLCVATDAAGNVYVGGYIRDTVDFGGGPLVSAGQSDIFVAKYNSAGTFQWAVRAGDTGYDAAMGIAADASGNVYATGSFEGTINFGTGDITALGSSDTFLVKFNSAGAVQWALHAGGTNYTRANDVAVGPSGNPVIVGAFDGTSGFGTAMLTSDGNGDVFVAEYSSMGSIVWATRAGGTGPEDATAVAVGASGNVVITGKYREDATFGTTTITHKGRDDIFAAKIDASGNHVWAWGAGNTGSDDRGFGVAVDGSGNVITTGQFAGDISFDRMTMTSGGSFDMFLYKTGPDGS